MADNRGDDIPTDLGGWNWWQAQVSHANAETQAETGLSEQELSYHFQKCFETNSGKIVLDHLTILQEKYKDFDPELGFYNGAAFGFWRSGQRSIVNYLKTRSRGAKKDVNS